MSLPGVQGKYFQYYYGRRLKILAVVTRSFYNSILRCVVSVVKECCEISNEFAIQLHLVTTADETVSVTQ
jgi:hypothetical protein